ncbi:hypothetical protein OAF09_00920 [bacterium]|nr:hypothetical protein [Rubripirellula sp.]MDB4338924.1 hypothetical protein [Rubripirellula sp.]MDB4676768.1 hypothetical protein [bacterium]
MQNDVQSIPDLLRIGPHVTLLPIVHGSGQFALTVRKWMLDKNFDCLAVPLPRSFQGCVESAILDLPRPSIVIQRPQTDAFAMGDSSNFSAPTDWDPETEEQDDPETPPISYVPIDPCQGVISAIRAALGEHLPRVFIDLESSSFQPFATVMPDPYAVKHVAPEQFAAAVLPAIPRPPDSQTENRIRYMAGRLKKLESRYQRILMVTSVLHWPWIREAYNSLSDTADPDLSDFNDSEPSQDSLLTETYDIEPKTLTFLFGELPFITSLYEKARSELENDENMQIDGVKELLIAARDAYRSDLQDRGRRVTSSHLSKCLQYIRNLSLIHRRLTPDLITIVTATQQILGDEFALRIAEIANQYAGNSIPLSNTKDHHCVTLGIDQARLPNGDTHATVSRLPAPPVMWRTIQLQRRPNQTEKKDWQYNWDPFSQCSYPPEDSRIETFRSRVFARAKSILGSDLAVTEKFTTSVKDGIDIRDTLRHWHEKQIYVRVNPPNRGILDACVMLFDSPSDPREYPWRTTWFAEHQDESTLAFYATHFRDELVGPGIGMGTYGGALFLYPPKAIPDIWQDPRLDYCETLEERLLSASCLHSAGKEIALLSALPPGAGWRKLAKRYRKRLVHIPLSSFSDEHIQQLRRVHVLNGTEVRSYADEFIRKR